MVFPHVPPSVSAISLGVSAVSPQCFPFPILDFANTSIAKPKCVPYNIKQKRSH